MLGSSGAANGTSFTTYGWLACFWGLITSFQHGYHVSVLNQIQAVLICEDLGNNTNTVPWAHKPSTCISMSDLEFSFVTSVLAIGGLCGSMVANLVIDSRGRRGTHWLCAVFGGVGNVFMGLGGSIFALSFGRFLIGFASGLGLCVGPIYMAEIVPSGNRGISVLMPMSIGVGIMVTQIVGLNFATPDSWRYVFLVSLSLSAFQAITAFGIVESPAFLLTQNRLEEQKTSAHRLWGGPYVALSPEEPDLNEPQTLDENQLETSSLLEVFKRTELRIPLLVVCLAMLSQQISGINAVLFYSNNILSKTLPDLGPYVSVVITMVNVMMSIPSIFLLDRLGRRKIFILSTFVAVCSVILIGYGLNSNSPKLASVAIVTFIMAFAFGLGPIPFVILPEVSPRHAVSALSSIALSTNWIVGFVVGLVFIPFQYLLSGGDELKEGRIFYLFAGLLSLAVLSLSRLAW
ncbi:general substrate transporter [Crepidotus variabilis]|uniref:General substrate transporter n=1 Tax=Crepidotus variabilis TaxID=179855 RepID=A0A9P6ENN2_9AGAR|nr:general substrate transporter [Crepidotus variabilis]